MFWSPRLGKFVPAELYELLGQYYRGVIGITTLEREARRLGFTRSELWILYGEFERGELMTCATWHIVVYKRYISAERPKDNRHFEVHLFEERKLEPDEALSKARDIFIHMLKLAGKPDMTIEGYLSLWDEVLTLACIGYEPLPVKVRGWLIIDLAEHYAPYVWYDVRGIRPLLNYRRTHLGIDLDEVSFDVAASTLRLMRDYPLIREAELYETRSGWHIRAKLIVPMDFDRKMQLRQAFRDDPERMACDMTKMRIGTKVIAYEGYEDAPIVCEGITDVLFSEKYKPELTPEGEWTGRYIVSRERKVRI